MEHGFRVWIKDNGIGIAVEHHARVFEMFQRLHESEKQFPGTGVGLAIVKKGIERIGGTGQSGCPGDERQLLLP